MIVWGRGLDALDDLPPDTKCSGLELARPTFTHNHSDRTKPMPLPKPTVKVGKEMQSSHVLGKEGECPVDET